MQLHHVGAPLSQPIAPVTYMWRPVCQQNRDSDAMDRDGDGCDKPENIESGSSSRQMWVWIHVSAFSEGFDALKFACQKEVRILNLVLITESYFSLSFEA